MTFARTSLISYFGIFPMGPLSICPVKHKFPRMSHSGLADPIIKSDKYRSRLAHEKAHFTKNRTLSEPLKKPPDKGVKAMPQAGGFQQPRSRCLVFGPVLDFRFRGR